MKLSRVLLPLFCVATIAIVFSCARPPEKFLAITNVTVIDMTGGAPRSGQTVLVVGDRIVTVGATRSVRLPHRATIVDGTGKFLIPGLADMHVHLTAASEPDGSRRFMIPLFLANGITTVRDMGGYLESLVPLREEIKKGKRLGPQIFYAGPYLDGSPPSFEPSFVVTNQTQANEDVRQLVQRGVDFIKVQSMLSRNAYFAIAETAGREHITFVGHVPDHVTAAEAADAGQHSIEHLTNVLRACSGDEPKLMREQFYVPPNKEMLKEAQARVERWQRELLSSFSQRATDALIEKFVAKDVWQTPTLVLLKNNAFPTTQIAADQDEREKYIPSASLALWKKGRSEQMRFVTAEESELRSQLFAKSASLVGQMWKGGVHVLAGTDSPAPYVFPGFALHDELAMLVDAGLTPMEALQTATRKPATFLGTTNDSGTVAPGKYADLVLLDADPVEEIRNTRRIRAVVVRGKVLDRNALDEMLESVRSFAGTH